MPGDFVASTETPGNTQLTVQNKSLKRENEKLRCQCEKSTQKVAEKS